MSVSEIRDPIPHFTWFMRAASWPSPISQHAGYPSMDPPAVGGVVGAEARRQALLVVQHAPVKPGGARDQQEQREPRPEREREPQHEDEMAEIHRVARVTVGAGCDDAVGRHLHALAAARLWQ